jgi:hypothetical protein
MRNSNPCKPDCPLRNAFCHSECKDYLDWAAENEVKKKATRDAKAPDSVRLESLIAYKHKAEPHKAIRMYIHK